MENVREFYEVYATYSNKSNERVIAYSKETALKVINDETVKAFMKSPHLIMIDGRTGEIVAESKPSKKDLNKLIDIKIEELIVEYCKQQCISTGDTSPQDELMLNTIKADLFDCIYEICNKRIITFSPTNRILTNFLEVGYQYGFRTELTKYGGCIYAKNTDGEDIPWIKYIVSSNLYSITGNTDYWNLWFCDTRTDLTPEKIIKFVKDLNQALELNEPILLKDLIDPEDWQEIADVRDAYEDKRYTNN